MGRRGISGHASLEVPAINACKAALRARSVENVVTVAIPGILLTRRLFSLSRLRQAMGTEVVDTELGEEVIRTASSVDGAADAIVLGMKKRHAGSQAILVGHSYGGYVALEVARRSPSYVAGLVLLSTQCRGDTVGSRCRRKEQVALALSKGTDAVLDSLMPMLLSQNASNYPEAVEKIRDMARDVGAETFALQMGACMWRADQRATLESLCPNIPVLVIAGALDRLIPPRCAREMFDLLHTRSVAAVPVDTAADDIGGFPREVAPWRVVIEPDSGHLVPIEQPDALHRQIASWTSEVRAFRDAGSTASVMASE